MKKLAAFSLALVALIAYSVTMHAQQAKKHRVVIDVTNPAPEVWGGVLNGIQNIQKALGPQNVEIEVVGHERGLSMLVKAANPSMLERMQQIAGTGVVFAACENSMRHQNVTKADLFPFDITVDSGAAELIRKQDNGWAYIKAGP